MPNWKTYESSVRLLSAILAAHPDLKLNYSETAKAFGGDCTKWAIDNRFRSLKTDAKKIVDALASGLDPITLDIPSGVKNIAAYYGDCTSYALDHRFRKIKQSAKEMRAGRGVNPIADKYEQGVTAKAVSTRFERLRKEPDWLGNSTNGDAPHSAAPKAPRTPKKKVIKKTVSDEDNEDDEEAEISPFKFTPKESLNKTKGGRISKVRTPRKAAASVPSYVESGGEEDEEDEEISDEYNEEKVSIMAVKSESNEYGVMNAASNFAAGDHAGNSFSHSFGGSFSNGNGNGHSNGQAGGFDMDDEDEFHEARHNQFGNGYEDDDAV
ncbi:hypothetical protein VE03_02176 [Pseudogymnoascus sp. 23342-1-I1]|nr:hypothetical protein VE03_02176 [Pseudogymnoascus sp. 23342-1-I1]